MMRRWISFVLVPLLLCLMGTSVDAASLGGSMLQPGAGKILVTVKPPVPVAFSAIPNRYTDVDPSTSFDLDGDLVGDLTVSATTVTGQNGTQVQLIDPPMVSLDLVQNAPASGYSPSAAAKLSQVYVAKLPGGGYAKFMLVQKSPKVTIWFHFGMPTDSTLTADGTGGHAVLTWGALPDATLGYNIYRYEYQDNFAYTVTLLNDFTVQETTFIDNTALNHYYLYVVVAIKAGGAFGSTTTVAPVNVQSLQRAIVITLATGSAKLDGSPITMDSAPVIKNGRLMVPATLLTSAGVKVTFESATGQITMARRLDNVTYTIVMSIETPDYTWNGSTNKADVGPYKAGSVVMIPLRVVAPALGFGLNFNSTDRTATVNWFE